MFDRFLSVLIVAALALLMCFPNSRASAAEPLPAPKTVTITTDDLAAMIDAAVAKALDKRFGVSVSVSAGGCGAAVDASACGASASACGAASTGRQGRLFGGGRFFGGKFLSCLRGG